MDQILRNKKTRGQFFDRIEVETMSEPSRGGDKISGNYWQLWDIPLCGRDIDQVLKVIEDQIDTNSNKPFWIATVNPEFVMEAQKDRQFLEILQETDLNVMDGVGLIWAQMMKEGNGWHRENLVPGVELMERMCQLAERKGKTVYFFGGWGDRAKRTADYFLTKYPKLKVAGFKEEDFELETKTDFLFVARGMKKQEQWIEQNLPKLKVKVVMGVGRSFDYYSGDLKRAPEWMRKMGLEWLYSLYKEPKRWKRQLALPRFVWKILTD
ncbi:MAG: WecB/TagA/CpsF family glycosyltransferase [Candidatus Shapirobacteria bacterium]|nr:WecB/TagA/CpsF family glycosyltransferase [Candidatus Shapirobacteria bacterium]